MQRLLFLVLVLVLMAGCTPPKPPPTQYPPPAPQPWAIVTHLPGGSPRYLANGYLGVRLAGSGLGSDAEGLPLPCFIGDAYFEGDIRPAPNWFRMEMTANGERLFPTEPLEYEQTLDMKTGVLTTRWKQWVRGVSVAVTTEAFVSKKDAALSGLRMSVTAESAVELTVGAGMVAPQEWHHRLPQGMEFGQTSSSRGRVVATWSPGPGTPRKAIHTDTRLVNGLNPNWDAEKLEFRLELSPGNPAVFERMAVVQSESKLPPVFPDFQRALSEHLARWEQLWRADIEIEGDPVSQQRVRSWLFYLYSSASTDGRTIPPMGLSSDLYKGHAFWDADIWMFPALLPLYPEAAGSMVEYRLRTLDEAKANATRTGFRGARFPWEGDLEGIERAPDKFRDELHIVGNVAWAAWQRVKWSGRQPTPQEQRLFRETADFWLSKAQLDPTKNRYVIRQVISPDEGELVDNDLYTNALARWNLEMASRLMPNPDPRWRQVAGRIYLPFDAEKQIYAAWENDPQEIYKQAVALLVIYPLGMPIDRAMQERMLAFYAPKTNPAGPAMAQAIDSIVAARLGKVDQAWDYFNRGFVEFAREPMLLFSETRRSGKDRTYFTTGAGGCLQAVLYGFAGIRLDSPNDFWPGRPTAEGAGPTASKLINGRDRLSVAPVLPKGWTRLNIKGVRVHDQVFDILISRTSVEIRPVEGRKR